jgi:hypothetical protein
MTNIIWAGLRPPQVFRRTAASLVNSVLFRSRWSLGRELKISSVFGQFLIFSALAVRSAFKYLLRPKKIKN